MKKITIRNFGPVCSANLDLGKTNIIIGLQSSGKSCVLKTACYCAWVEKRIQLAQNDESFKGDGFMKRLESYYRLQGYVREDTEIAYETSFMKFIYSHRNKEFILKWKTHRWDYRRPKVSYVPSERNMVSMVKDFSQLSSFEYILDFMDEWDNARHSVAEGLSILNLGLRYKYNEFLNDDRIVDESGVAYPLAATSSGIQSLVPLFVHLDYLDNGLFEKEKKSSLKDRREDKGFALNLYRKRYEEKRNDNVINDFGDSVIVEATGFALPFASKQLADEYLRTYNRYSQTDHIEVFLEEPENNLFPSTQCQLVDRIVDSVYRKKHSTCFVATHSPYVLNHFLEKQLADFRFFFTHREADGRYSVRTASDEDVQEIYDYGVDMFFNSENYCR